MKIRRFQVFGIITTIVEISGATLIAVGIGLCFGLGAALITGGILILAGSYLATVATERSAE
jgi:hypothetical protein